jgi:hypothetical protein
MSAFHPPELHLALASESELYSPSSSELVLLKAES